MKECGFMNILIITTYFPPDTAIAAVRPYMLAKYLTRLGENVTVIRLGVIDKLCGEFDLQAEKFEVITVDEGSSRTVNAPVLNKEGHKHLVYLPECVRRPLKTAYNTCKDQYLDLKWIESSKKRFERQKMVIDNMADKSFDIVFSTYGELENVFAGEYASKRFGAKWIMDFRDPLTAYNLSMRPLRNIYADRVQSYALDNADLVTTVSYSISAGFRSKGLSARVVTLTNGFDPESSAAADPAPEKGVFRLCYTGQLYKQRVDALKYLVRTIKYLIDKGSIDRNRIRVAYAGSESKAFSEVFEEAGLSDIAENYGYLDKKEVVRLQMVSDVFLVLSWNTKRSRGVITGKFYEGISAELPILSVVSGDTPNSELDMLDRKYGYGICCECCRKGDRRRLCGWLTEAYNAKIASGSTGYKVPAALKQAFRYDKLALKLQRLMQSIL